MEFLLSVSSWLAVADFPIDFRLMVYAVVAFIVVGVGLASMILFTKAKLVSSEEVKIFINNLSRRME